MSPNPSRRTSLIVRQVCTPTPSSDSAHAGAAAPAASTRTPVHVQIHVHSLFGTFPIVVTSLSVVAPHRATRYRDQGRGVRAHAVEAPARRAARAPHPPLQGSGAPLSSPSSQV